jgi:hypothetical protein
VLQELSSSARLPPPGLQRSWGNARPIAGWQIATRSEAPGDSSSDGIAHSPVRSSDGRNSGVRWVLSAPPPQDGPSWDAGKRRDLVVTEAALYEVLDTTKAFIRPPHMRTYVPAPVGRI